MPTYEYDCQKCHKHFEIVQSMKDSSLKSCPEDLCRMRRWGKGKVHRVLSLGAGLIFKGSGFYTTDYRSESYKQAAKKESEAASPSKKEGDSSTVKKGSSTKETSAKKTDKTA